MAVSCGEIQSSVEARNCKQQLRSLWAVLALYRQEHNGQLPPSLENLDTNLVGRLLACPGGKLNPTTRSNYQAGYYYVDWTKHQPQPNFGAGKYPLIYDRFMLNHDGKGVNVLMMDGSVMWDADAEWLKKFASENTNVTLSIPVQ